MLSLFTFKFRAYLNLPSFSEICLGTDDSLSSDPKLGEFLQVDTLSLLVKNDIELMEQRLEAQQIAIEDMEKRNEQLMKQLESMTKAANLQTVPEAGGTYGYSSPAAMPVITPDVVHSLNIHQKSEFELIPFVSFTKDRLYQLEPGLTHRPEDIPRGDKKAEMDEVIDTAVFLLNKVNEANTGSFSVNDLIDGVQRTDHVMGSQYELFFSSNEKSVFHHITLFRPFRKVQKVKTEVIDKSHEWINIIVPLAGR
jgi:hypothetical protein